MCLKYHKNCLENISKHYDNFAIKRDCLEIFQEIVPDKILYKTNSYCMPKQKSSKIDKIEIYTDPGGGITSVKIHGEHPNADKNGWFCLGSLKHLQLNKEGIDQLISNITYYKLDDCYWDNSKVKNLIKEVFSEATNS